MNSIEDLQRRWPDHLGLMVTVGTFGLIVLRVLAVSDWNPQTATAVVAAGGATNVALAVALTSVPLVASLVVWLLALRLGVRIFREGWAWISGYLYVFSIGLFVLLFLVPVLFMIVAVLIVLGAGLFRWRRKRHPAKPRTATERASIEYRYVWPSWVLLLAFTLASQPYLPTERFEPDGDKPYTGFVVGHVEQGTVVVLTYRDPKVLREPVSTPHDYCEVASKRAWDSIHLLDFARPKPYPNCPVG